jgi:hypothetical protein
MIVIVAPSITGSGKNKYGVIGVIGERGSPPSIL